MGFYGVASQYGFYLFLFFRQLGINHLSSALAVTTTEHYVLDAFQALSLMTAVLEADNIFHHFTVKFEAQTCQVIFSRQEVDPQDLIKYKSLVQNRMFAPPRVALGNSPKYQRITVRVGAHTQTCRVLLPVETGTFDTDAKDKDLS